MTNSLGSFELCTYFFVWSIINVFSLYYLFNYQSDILKKYSNMENLSDLQPGWDFTLRYKDVSDVEWSSWKYFIQLAWSYLFFQFIVTEIIRRNYQSTWVVKYWYIISSSIFVALYMGVRPLFIVVTQPLLYAGIIFLGGQYWTIWTVSIALLISYNSLKYKYFFWYFLDRENLYDEEVYLLIFSVAWTELRCVSFCLDYVERDKKTFNLTKLETFVNLLSYALYLPVMFSGPVILYDEFEKSFQKDNGSLALKLKAFVFDSMLYLIYSAVMELSLHYIYFYAMQSDMELIRQLPTMAVCGGGLYMGLHFHMKYVIAYGTTTTFAKLDNIDTPPTPRCIARIHVYSQMWKYFDVGLYKFLVKYIHRPSTQLVRKHFKVSNTATKLIASLSTFIFIFLWHGTIKRILIWSILNYLGIMVEYLSKDISETAWYKRFKNTVLKTDQMETRFIALLCVPLLALSAVSNFYLFAGTEVGNLFFESVFYPNLWTSMYICLALYCCCNVSMALESYPSRTDHVKVH